MKSLLENGIGQYQKQKNLGEMNRLETALTELDRKLMRANNELRLHEVAIRSKATGVAQKALANLVFSQVFGSLGGLLATINGITESWTDLDNALNSSNPQEKYVAMQLSRAIVTLASLIPTVGPVFEFMKLPLDTIDAKQRAREQLPAALAKIKAIEKSTKELRMALAKFKSGVLLNRIV